MSVLEKNVEKMREIIEAETVTDNPDEVKQLERMNYRLSDAIREGSKVAGQAYTWATEDGSMCALSAAVTAAKARGYIA